MAAGDLIRLHSPVTNERWNVSVLYEDGSLLAIDKPSRLLIAPDRWDAGRPDLMTLLHDGLATSASWAAARETDYLANAHRLDFETSGIVLLAKNKPALTHVCDQFGAEQVKKTYLALVHGRPEENEFVVDAKIAPHAKHHGVMVSSRFGKKALTRFTVKEAFRGTTLLQCFPMTGRTHQIRVHLKIRGLPICGDEVYGGRPLLLSSFKNGYRIKPGRAEKPLIDRVALHAWKLSVKHPRDGQTVAIESPWPAELEVALKYLRRFASINPGSSASQSA